MRASVEVRGIVQGVGFRPFIHRLVERHGLEGWVRNTSEGAELEVEGGRAAVGAFVREISAEAPPLALIESVEVTELPGSGGYGGFRIIESGRGEEMRTLVSPDTGICADCLRELLDPADRRYRYPFINCTNCGPRFTIIKSVPYDRAYTSMSDFPMCPDCAREFADIRDRRYHAQPDCCPECGPEVFFLDAVGRRMPGDAIETARGCLKAGKIICVKGLGGMHLACLAGDEAACSELRRRKQRDEKPFAVMCRSVECAKRICRVTEVEERLLVSHKKPIVLLEKLGRGAWAHLSENNSIGVMLPYTPLHVLLMGGDIDCLVMTSANLSDTPIVYKNSEAVQRLSGIADGFLLHNREIVTRCDDSLMRVFEGREYPLRRSRGYVPYPVIVPGLAGGLLACGAEQKASFCMSKLGHAFPSQHIGDLKNAETLEAYEGQIAHFERLFDIKPRAIACDLHPDYLSTAYAEERSEREGIPLLRVQHHHAHLAACMADNGLEGECLGLIWDGVGLGTDGTAWGGELLRGSYSGFERLGSIHPLLLPGGDAAVKDVWRLGLSAAVESGADTGEIAAGPEAGAVKLMISKRVSCPESSGMGRLFDAACSLAGIRQSCTYEGQGAVLLEAAASVDEDGEYEARFYVRDGLEVFDWRPMVRDIISERRSGIAKSVVAARFMNTLVSAAVKMAEKAADMTHLHRIVLSGGVFQNMYLMNRLPGRLRAAGLEVFTHSRVSANDEGLSLGQLRILEAKYVLGGATENCRD